MEKGNGLYHKLDKILGIPVVMMLGIPTLFIKNHIPDSIKRIAILNLGSIGDNVLMSAAIADLKSKYSESEIIVFTGDTNYQIVKLIPFCDQVVKLSVSKIFASFISIRSKGKFDVLIDFGPWPRINSIFSSFFRSDCKIGFSSKNQFRHYVYDVAIKHSPLVHEIQNFKNLISPLVEEANHKPALEFAETERTKDFLSRLNRFCIIHPWPGGYKSYMKEWGNENWIALIEKIVADFDYIIVTGAPSDKENTKRLFSLINSGKIINACGMFDLNELIAIISRAKIIFSVNTGIAHIAAALNKPQVCLHGPTNVDRWRPYSETTLSVTPFTGTFGYLNYGFEYNRAHGPCMENISVERVHEAYLEIKPT